MEVQIKGFSMPDSCVDCKMAYDGSYCILVEDDNDAVEGGKMWRRCPLLKRPNWCPLEEVRHGEWILEREPDGTPYCYHCSVCDSDFHHIGITTASRFCPNCGAELNCSVREAHNEID